MAEDSAELLVGASGNIYVGSLGSTLPTNATAAPDAAFKELGYATEDGVSVTNGLETVEISGWQSFYALRRIVTARNFQVSFTLMQWNYDTAAFALGGATVTGASPNYTITPPAVASIDERAMIIDLIDGSNKLRWVLPRGMVTDNVTSQFQRNAAGVLPITFSVTTPSGGAQPWTAYVNGAFFSAS